MASVDPSRSSPGPRRVLLGRYEQLRVLGRGAMGEVLEVRDSKSGERYALKRVPPELARQSSQLKAIRANFKLVHSLAHPHIAVTRFLECDDATGDVYILMDLVRGQDLDGWLQHQRERLGDPSSPLPLTLALGIAEQAAAALDYAHAQPIYDDEGRITRTGILHRDLKPANVMVVDGREHRPGVPYIQLVDFGLAAEIQASMLSQTQQIDNVNALAGTPLYMAPEQWLGRRLTRGIDQWALAVMIYEMAEGCPPFHGPTRAELRDQVVNHPPQPPETLSPMSWTALSAAFAKDRSRRYASCAEMVRTIAVAAGTGGSFAPSDGFGMYPSSPALDSAYPTLSGRRAPTELKPGEFQAPPPFDFAAGGVRSSPPAPNAPAPYDAAPYANAPPAGMGPPPGGWPSPQAAWPQPHVDVRLPAADATLVPPEEEDTQGGPVGGQAVFAVPTPPGAGSSNADTAGTMSSATEFPSLEVLPVEAVPPEASPPAPDGGTSVPSPPAPATGAAPIPAPPASPPEGGSGWGSLVVGMGTVALLIAAALYWPKADPVPTPLPAPPMPTGKLVVKVDQLMASLAIDDEAALPISITMEAERTLLAGEHRIRVSKLGFFAFEQQVTVVAGETQVVRANLRPLSSDPDPNSLFTKKGGGSQAKRLVDETIHKNNGSQKPPATTSVGTTAATFSPLGRLPLVRPTTALDALSGPRPARVGETLSFMVLVNDPNKPPGLLSYRLESTSPKEATIGAFNGRLEWTPPPAAAGKDFVIRVVVSTTTTGVASLTLDFPVKVAPLAPPKTPGDDPWPALLGPRGDGASPSTRLPLTWSETKHIAWKTEIPGRGWSSPVVWDDQVWLTAASEDGKQRFAIGVDKKTGKIVHDVELKPESSGPPGRRTPATGLAGATPAIEADAVYVHFGRDGTACIDPASGKVRWERRDLVPSDPSSPANSPILFGDLLIVEFEGAQHRFVAALDKKNGKTLWQKELGTGRNAEGGPRRSGYPTPTVYEIAGQPQLVAASDGGIEAFDPRTGAALWGFNGTAMNPTCRPVLADGLLIVGGGGQTRIVALRPSATKAESVWQRELNGAMNGGPVVADGRIFFLAHDHGAAAIDLRSGKSIWSRPLAGRYWSNPLVAGGRLYCFNLDGRCTVLSTVDGAVLAENTLDGGAGFRASPAVSRDALYVRTPTHLYRLEGAD